MPRLRILAIVQNYRFGGIWVSEQSALFVPKTENNYNPSLSPLVSAQKCYIVQTVLSIVQTPDFQIIYYPNLDNTHLSRGIGQGHAVVGLR